MSLIQIKDANWRVPYIGGWCEGYVEGAWGQATLPAQDSRGNWFTNGVWGNAVAAVNPGETGKWNSNPGNGNHPNELPPVGKTVPVYFSLGSTKAGHTAISLDDGKVASSTQAGVHSQGYIHPNLQDLINIYGKYNSGCTYLGWSEYVGNIQVVSQQSNNATDDQIRQAYLDILERPADDGGLAHYRNYTNDQVRADLMASNERAIVVARHAAADAAAAQAQIDAANAAQALANQQAADAAKILADQQAAIAEAARQKAIQDVIDAQKLKDAQLADEKKRADAEALEAADNTAFIIWLKSAFEWLSKLLTSWRK